MSNRYQPQPSRYPPPRPGYNRRYESDKWERDRERRQSPRSRSPPLRTDRRDSRDYPPREIDTDRAQRQPHVRDGAPPSAGSVASDAAASRFPNPPFRTPSYGRGPPPGRQEWTEREYQNRGRPRAYDGEGGDSFRPNRSRSPRIRDRSVDSRDYDRREREYRERNEDSYRYRPTMRDSRDERDGYQMRRDLPPRSDGRHPSDPRPPDSISQTGPDRSRQISPRRSPVDSRRSSTVVDVKDVRRPNDEAPSSVAVPQFGSIVLPAPSAPSKPKSPVTTPASLPPPTLSPTQFSPPFSQSQQSPQLSQIQPAKVPPTAPRALFNPPTAPKADRIGERPSAVKDMSVPPEDVKRDATRPVAQPVTPRPEQEPVTKARSVGSVGTSPVMMNQRIIPPTAPTGPRSTTFARASSAGPLPRDMSPTQQSSGVPSGPRSNRDLASKGLPMNTPTAPKALSNPTWQAPTGPRLQKGYGPPTSIQWRANQQTPGQQPALLSRSGTTSMLGVKRDANGEEKERSMSMDHASVSIEQVVPRRLSAIPQDRYDNKKLDKLRDVDMMDAPDRASSPEQTSGSYSASSDDGMSVDEDDFAKQEARYHKRKAELESQMVDLSAKRYRAVTPIAELERLNGILGIIDLMPFAPSPPPDEKMELEEPTDEPLEIENADIIEAEMEPEMEQEPSPIPSHVEEIITRKSSPELSRSPDIEYLPYLAQRPPTPLSMPENGSDELVKDDDDDDEDDEDDDDVEEDIKNELLAKLEEIKVDESSEQGTLMAEYASQYPGWREEVRVLDRQRIETMTITVENKPEDIIVEPPPEIIIPPPLPAPSESRRGLKYSSELEFQRVLAESKLAEDLRREKEAREALESFPSVDREADIPDQLSAEEFKQYVFEDTSMKRPPEQALMVYEFAPPQDTIMDDVDKQFRGLFKQYAKHWHKLADDLQVTTKEVINHYYATKWVYSYKRGSKHKSRARGFARKPAPTRKPEAENADGGALTLSGRPRRNAAPTFGRPDIDTEADGSTPTPGNGRRNKGEPNASLEDKIKKTKTKKEPGKKPRPGTKTANPSPQKAIKDKKEKAPSAFVETPEDWMAGKHDSTIAPQDGRMMPTLLPHHHHQQQQMLGTMTLLPQPILQPQPQPQQAPPSIYAEQAIGMPVSVHHREKQPSELPAPPSAIRPLERPRSNSQPQKPGASSYWSVGEDAEFRHCLEYFGTDFQAIANHMGKKTVVMIKNRFQKFSQDGKHKDLLDAAYEADARRERGEPLPAMPEILRPHGTKANLEEQPQSGIPIAPQQPMIPHGSPQYRSQGRFPIEETPLGAASPQDVTAIMHQPGLQARGTPKRGPPSIYGSLPVGQSQHASVQPSPPGRSQMDPGAPRQPKEVQRIKTEHVGEQSRSPMQSRDNSIPLSRQEPPPGMVLYQGLPLAPNPGSNILPIASADAMRHDGPSHAHPHASHIPMGATPALRQPPIDPTEQARSRYPMGYEPGRGGRPQSPDPMVRDYSSSGTGYAGDGYRARDPPQTHTPQPAASAPPTAPKRSVMSMASMLNPEPSDDKPKKSEFQHSSSSSRGGGDLQHRSSSYHHGLNVPSPASDIPSAVSSNSQRESWHGPGRATYGQPYHESPRLQPQPASAVEVSRPPPMSEYRAGTFGHGQRQTAPSPPPSGTYSHSHSRTGSYSHPHHPHHHQHQHIQSQPGSQGNTPTEPFHRGPFAPATAGMSPSPLPPAQARHNVHSGPPPPGSGPQHRYGAYPTAEAPNVALRAYRNSTASNYDGPPPPGGHDPRMTDPYGREMGRSPMGGERYPPPPPPPGRGPVYERDYRMREREREDDRRYGH